MSRVVVIGAGVGGLAVSARLAAQGHVVTLLEAADEVGGKLGLHERDGFRFDTGPSLVTLPHLLREVFEDTGGWPASLELEPLDPLTHYRFADGTTLDTSNDPAVTEEHWEALRAGNGTQWRDLHSRGERVWRASERAVLSAPLDGPRDLLRLAAQRPTDLAAIAPGRTLRHVARRLADPRMRDWLDRYATYSGSDPRRAPAALTAVPYAEQAYGGWWVRGGLRRIAEELLARCLSLGVELRTAAHVDAVLTEGRRASGVRLASGEQLRADAVVSGVDAAQLYGDLVPSRPASRRLARATPSSSGFVLLLAVRGRTPGLAHHTVLFPERYDEEFDALFGDPRPVEDPTLYISAPDDPAVRPEGHEGWFVLVNAPRHGNGQGQVDWRAPGVAERYAEHLLDLLAARGLPVRDRLLWREIRTPADLEERTGSPGGAIYGTSSNGAAAAFLRPANRSPVPGLLLVGGSAHPGGGLPLVLLSARIVAGLVDQEG